MTKKSGKEERSQSWVFEDYPEGTGKEMNRNKRVNTKKRADGIKLFYWDLTRNNGAKQIFEKVRAKELDIGSVCNAITLFPFGRRYICAKDAKLVKSNGIAVVNCSWSTAPDVSFEKFGKVRYRRALPVLRSACPETNGQLLKLSNIEAIGATLIIAGFVDEAMDILGTVDYGIDFVEKNQEWLEKYSECQTNGEMKAAQKEFLSAMKSKKDKSRNTNSSYVDETIIPELKADRISSPEYEEVILQYMQFMENVPDHYSDEEDDDEEAEEQTAINDEECDDTVNEPVESEENM